MRHILLFAFLIFAITATAQSSRGFAATGFLHSLAGKNTSIDFSKRYGFEFFIDRNTVNGFIRAYAGAMVTPKTEGVKTKVSPYFNFLGGYQFGNRFKYYGSAGVFAMPTGDKISVGPSVEIGWGFRWASLIARANYGLVDMDATRSKKQSTFIVAAGVRATLDVER